MIIFSIIIALVTIMFCFWYIYILDAMRRKWKFYKNSSNRLLERNGSNQEEIIAYNAETEFVKYVFLFFINLLEWTIVVFIGLNFLPNLVLDYNIHVQSLMEGCYGNFSKDDQLLKMRHFLFYLPFFNWAICCIIFSLVLNASLCMYLAARQAKLSWMKSNKVPYLIAFFLISLILNQIISGIHSTYNLISYLCYSLLLTFALLYLVKQYRKLLMVINWSIVDLQISGNIHLLRIQIQMKRKFTRISKLSIIGYIIGLSALILGFIIQIGLIFIEQHNSCVTILGTYYHVYDTLYLMNLIMGLIGIIFFFIPYIGFGLSTMCVIFWRLINGKTGYKTHFNNPLNNPLI